MAGLNVSLSFFFATFVLCQAARRACKALLPAGAYASFAREAVGAAQLGACCLEMRMLAELGPWAGGFGPDLLLTLLTLLLLVHGATCDGAAANPTVSLQDFLLAEASAPRTLLKLAAQGLGVRAACALTRLYWAWELCDLHVLQNLLDPHCSSPLRTPVSHGALVEGAGAFFLHLTLLRLRNSLPAYRVPAVALLATVMTHTAEGGHRPTEAADRPFPGTQRWHGGRLDRTRCGRVDLGPRRGRRSGWIFRIPAAPGHLRRPAPGTAPACVPGTTVGISGAAPLLAGEAAAGRAPRGRSVPPPTAGPFTSAFFNPALATWATFHCSGHTLLEYMQVYWLGPLTGMVLAVLLYHGRLPRLFQRNLLYSQKNKYRTPRGKPAPGPRDTQTPAEGCRSREPGRGGAGQPLPGSR
ncbi:aquaporin-12B-like [Panthera uncia]|uniref:aquaporin-12B-like n=1 Tax=Panthera uncia TaxID=29064 RepID=UPI0020FFE667|nr:aquaporin-12B-like [Panthera uncia]